MKWEEPELVVISTTQGKPTTGCSAGSNAGSNCSTGAVASGNCLDGSVPVGQCNAGTGY